MKKPLAFIFALTVAFEAILPGMEVVELMKLPALFTHFQQHQLEDSSISLFDFISLHYSDPDHHDKDPVTHHSLPFSNHHSHNCQLHQVIFTLPEITPPSTPVCQYIKPNTLYCKQEEATVLFAIWQPPKFC